jgi:hypothetical protein
MNVPAKGRVARRATSQAELEPAIAAMLAQPDPVGTFLKRTRGRLGKDHRLDY